MPEAVGRLVTDIEAELDALVDGIVARIRAEVPDFRRLPASTLARAVRGNVSRALAALHDLRPPTPDELERAAAVGRERAEQGLSVDAVLHAYRISISAVWSRFGELARERGHRRLQRARLLRDAVAVGRCGDGGGRQRAPRGRAPARARGAAAPRRVRARRAARHDRRRRALERVGRLRARPRARVRRLPRPRARGRRDAAAARLRRPHHRARPRPRRPLHAGRGAGPRRGRRRRAAGAARRPARRLRDGQPRAADRARLRAGGRLQPRRPLDPPGDPLRRGARRRLHGPPPRAAGRRSGGSAPSSRTRCACGSSRRCGSRRPPRRCTCTRTRCSHRLRRFEEATGASLRRPADLIELWWALERRRLARTAPAPPAPARSPTRGSSAAPAAGPV